MGPAQQKQSENLYFKQFDDKLLRLDQKFENIRSSGSEISNQIKAQIIAKKDSIKQYSINSKIYIVFMGTSSTGKSTLINSLLGQKLLPEKAQNCTSQVVYIHHQDAIVKGQANIHIDGLNYTSVKKASETLKKVFENASEMRKVILKTQSYYHQQFFPKDLQDRIVFIDTPGINLSQYKQQDYFDHFSKINEFIELDEYSIRLNIWVINYASFDSEKEIQKQMQYMVKGSDEQMREYQSVCENPELINRYQQFEKYENKILQQSTDKKNSFFFIINKYERNSEDNKLETIIEDTKSIFNSENIYKISGQKAFKYNVMNYGNQEAKKLFRSNFYEDHKQDLNFKDLQQAIDYCNKYFKNNHELIQSQDYNLFIQRTSLYIMDQLNGYIDQNLLNCLNQDVVLYQFVNSNIQQLSALQKNILTQFMSTFEQKKQEYTTELQPFKDSFLNKIETLIKETKIKIHDSDPKDEIKKTCKISIETLEATNEQIQKMSIFSDEQFRDKLKMGLILCNIEQNLLQNILNGCEQIFTSSMEDQFSQFSRQIFQTYSTELNSKMGITIKKSKLMYPLVFLGKIVLFFLDIQYTNQAFDQDLLNSSLDEWKLSLNQQIEDLIKNYVRIYSQTLDGIKKLIEQVNR